MRYLMWRICSLDTQENCSCVGDGYKSDELKQVYYFSIKHVLAFKTSKSRSKLKYRSCQAEKDNYLMVSLICGS